MALKIIRHDITKMHTDAIVNTANQNPVVGPGCDRAIYQAAGYQQLLEYRKEKIGQVQEGDVFLTPAFSLDCQYIIHAVSPKFSKEDEKVEERLRSCYRKSLILAREHHLESIAFPLIATGSFQYPKEEGMRIAVDEINAFLLHYDLEIYLVVFDQKSVQLGFQIYPGLKSFINQNYVEEKQEMEYRNDAVTVYSEEEDWEDKFVNLSTMNLAPQVMRKASATHKVSAKMTDEESYYEKQNQVLKERMAHLSDTFSEYLIYLIDSKGMTYPEVYKRAIVDKKAFSKIKNNPDAHPKKSTAMCLCVGAKLNMDQTKDLLARAGYALSPCDKTDIIFSYFIENKIYDMIELDIVLEEYGLPCFIS